MAERLYGHWRDSIVDFRWKHRKKDSCNYGNDDDCLDPIGAIAKETIARPRPIIQDDCFLDSSGTMNLHFHLAMLF